MTIAVWLWFATFNAPQPCATVPDCVVYSYSLGVQP